MRKVLLTIFALFILILNVNAANGDIAGTIYSTDIKAYINGIEVPSYNIGGKTAVVIEEILKEDSHSYSYSDYYRTLKIWSLSPKALVSGTSKSAEKSGIPTGRIYETDIITSMYDTELSSYNLGGRTAVVIEELGGDKEFSKLGGRYVWDEQSRTISLEFLYSTRPNLEHTDIVITANEDLTEGYAEFKEIYNCCTSGEHFKWPEWVNDKSEITTVFPIKANDDVIGYYFRCPSKDYGFTAFTCYYPEKLEVAAQNYIALKPAREDVVNHYKQNHAANENERFETDNYTFVYMTIGLPRGVRYYLLQINADGTYKDYMTDINDGKTRIEEFKIDKENEKVYFTYDKEYVIDLKTEEFVN